jgi:hypothetical protein
VGASPAGPGAKRRGGSGAAIAAAAAILLSILGVPGASEARTPGVSPEIERILAETVFTRPPSDAATDDLLARLRRAGVVTPTDLHPYLSRSERVRANAVAAIARLGARNASTLLALAAFVHETAASGAPSAALALEVILETSPREEALHFALAEVSRLHFDALDALASWLTEQDPASLRASPESEALVRSCLRRMEALFGAGHYSGRWPLRFSLLVERQPFAEPAYAEAVSRTFVAAVANTVRTSDLRELAFVGAFALAARPIASGTDRGGQLLSLAGHAPLPLAKLVLWRLVAEGLDENAMGREIIGAATASFPELSAFVDLLRTPPQGGGPHKSTPLANEIAGALSALGGSPQRDGSS